MSHNGIYFQWKYHLREWWRVKIASLQIGIRDG